MNTLASSNHPAKLLCLLSLVFTPILGTGEIYNAKITIPRVNTAPKMDGMLDDKVWEGCIQISDFVVWTLDAYTKDPVMVYLGYDENNMYIAFRNSDPDASTLITEVPDKRLHDTFLWGRHFSRVTLNYGEGSIALMADPKGTMADWGNGDMAWNGSWAYAASIEKESWTAEFRIPFSDLGREHPPMGESWTLSLSRGFPKGESAEWNGLCSFSDESRAALKFGRWSEPVPGKNQLVFEAINTGKEKEEVICEIELIPFQGKPQYINQTGQGASSDMQLLLRGEPLRYHDRFEIPPGQFQKSLSFYLPTEGSYYATSTCMDTEGKVLLRNRGYWFILEPNSEKLERIRERLGEATASYVRKYTSVIDKLDEEAQDLSENLEKMAERINPAWENGEWDELSSRIDLLGEKVNQFSHKAEWASLNNWEKDTDFGITVAHPVVKLFRDKAFPGRIQNTIRLSAARNEYESFQLVVLPFGKDINNLSIKVTDLDNGNGSVISEEHIEISLVGYNRIDWQAAYVAEKGWHPDPLIPFSGPVTIPGSTLCQPFWITVYVPPDTPAGLYHGEAVMTASNGESQTARVQLRVWDFTLPVESHLKTHSWDNLDLLAGFYNLEEYPLEWYQRFCGLLLKNRMNPGSAGTHYVNLEPDASGNYDFSRVEKVLEYGIERGLNRFSIIQLKKGPYLPEEAEKVYAFIEAYAKFLQEKNWMDKALIELWDEPTSLEWEGVKARAERIREINPDLRLQLFAEGGPYAFWEDESKEYGLHGLIDIWAPWKIVESPGTQAAGDEIWTYFCTLARGIAPNFYIDRPAIYQRLITWYCWMYGVDGFEHWSTTYFWRNVNEEKPMDEKWPNTGWDSRTYHHYNGEGQLIYPGSDGWPYPSIRLEIFRDSMEDYEYLYLLKELIEKTRDKSGDDELQSARQLLDVEAYMLKKYPMEVKETQENTILYPDQPERILEAREKIAEAIEKISR